MIVSCGAKAIRSINCRNCGEHDKDDDDDNCYCHKLVTGISDAMTEDD